MLPTGSFLFTSIFRWGAGYRSLLRPSSLVASGIALLLSVANPSGEQLTNCLALVTEVGRLVDVGMMTQSTCMDGEMAVFLKFPVLSKQHSSHFMTHQSFAFY